VGAMSDNDRTLRLLYVNSHFQRADMWTGVRARQLVEALTDQGVSVTMFPPSEESSGQAPRTTKKMRGLKNLVRDKLPTAIAIWMVEIWLFFGGALRSFKNALRAISMRDVLEADVILIRSQEYDWTPWLMGKILGLPVVQEIHSISYVERSQRKGKPTGGHWGPLSRMEVGQWRSASALWVNSTELQKNIVSNGLAPESVQFFPFGIAESPRQFPGERTQDGLIQIAFVGSFYPWHGVQCLVRAFAKLADELPNASLVLMGDGIMRARCEQEVEELGLGNRIEFTGWLPRDHMIERLRDVHIGVAPYLAVENFYFEPVKIFDYMAAGLPVVASAQGRVREMLEGGTSGCLMPPGDEAALTTELKKLCRDPDSRKSLGRAARQRYLDKYTLAITASRVIEVCSDVIESPVLGSSLPVRERRRL